VRWDELFDDLVGQHDAAAQAELDAEVADRSRWEAGHVRLLERLQAAGGQPVRLSVQDGTAVAGTLLGTGDGWLAVRDGGGHAVVPHSALARVDLGFRPSPGVQAPVSPRPATRSASADRVGLVQLGRRLARDRAYVTVRLRGGGVVAGTVDRAGGDHLDIAVHDADQPRRNDAVRGVAVVPFSAVLVLRAGQLWD